MQQVEIFMKRSNVDVQKYQGVCICNVRFEDYVNVFARTNITGKVSKNIVTYVILITWI